ncbi:hypothetical protein GCM10010988_40610 [Cnuibacter physcomitrellae]|uniref:Uncharacterized protein n=1 Tax=Cnuibacter physcomitrellae TaxID=1619308 RepID=A0A1X9LQZ7_9MICO|nr:DUF3093 domain-containing protein [Cnuibacter physcomitrellae]ARJ07624.1 hypothetical protein B5808_19795 [Cnuibacter physcomitrellae]GGI42752.1 hypothetical protein GCM10010988_40610 [Cnuibacter physcomitrellae]
MTPQPTSPLYIERMRPSLGIILSIALVIPASLVVFIPINPESDIPGAAVGITVGILLYAGILGLLFLTSPVIRITPSTLTVGRAHIDRKHLATASAHFGPDATAERGTRLDARSYLSIRGWIKPVAKITLNDPQDPTPYWLFSTRRPETLLAVLALPEPTPPAPTPTPTPEPSTPNGHED